MDNAQLKCAEAIGEYVGPLLPDNGQYIFKAKVRRNDDGTTILLGDMTLVLWPEWVENRSVLDLQDELVEEVARAIWESDPNRMSWGNVGENSKILLRDEARAVIPLIAKRERERAFEEAAKIAERHNGSQVWPMTGAKIARAIRSHGLSLDQEKGE